MIGFIVTLIVIGAIAGYLARLIVPGRDPMGFWATVVLGVIGSFIGGFIAYLIDTRGHTHGHAVLQMSGILGSILGAVIALLVYRAVNGRRLHI